MATDRPSSSSDFSEYAAANWTQLVRSARLLGARPADAEDLVQITLAKCFVSWHRVTSAHDTDAYVHRILINTWRRSMRRLWHREIPTDLSHKDLESLPESDRDLEALAVQTALSRLPEHLRAVLVLRRYVDLSVEQTAEALGIPAGTVKSRLSRAQAAFRSDAEIARLISEVSDD